MPLADVIIALSGILVTSIPIVFVNVNFKHFNDGSNEFIQLMLVSVCFIIQIQFWMILFYGLEAYKEDNVLRNWWPLIAAIVYVVLVLKPIRKKVYPQSGRSLFGSGKKDESDVGSDSL